MKLIGGGDNILFHLIIAVFTFFLIYSRYRRYKRAKLARNKSFLIQMARSAFEDIEDENNECSIELSDTKTLKIKEVSREVTQSDEPLLNAYGDFTKTYERNGREVISYNFFFYVDGLLKEEACYYISNTDARRVELNKYVSYECQMDKPFSKEVEQNVFKLLKGRGW